ncbi:fluoride efflux transporter CrcB [Planotetraspora phitsanulokensis]|uniref:Fluoride-specific ion channel FluC n=1 Tax=Planotetraspora phitsanulokensis TaxID=575192 RepID=A0A8J3XFY0_9ACTN|nr:fluoride efflux transporter CrcB [Planotetraspora phitsanulokensis]GII39590.1 putative fluoride ion transporter CrcB 1 [Planotetraspora phitsanulokensis]
MEAPQSEPIDSDVDFAVPLWRRDLWQGQGPVVFVVAVGGAIGACARYGASLLWPALTGAFPWATLLVNLSGCVIIGVFMVTITELWTAHRLVRPFVGTGILGGYTTFSTYAVDIQRLVNSGHAGTGLAYLMLTLVTALAGVWAAARLTRLLIGWRA